MSLTVEERKRVAEDWMQAIKATQRSVTALCSTGTNVGDSVFSPVSSSLTSKSSNSETGVE